MSADFTPSLNTYTDLTPFRFWCQKILPIAYDDSLSYYELLCKVVDYLNKTMEDVELSIEDVEKLHDAYAELQTYVNTYFANLDVQEEINNKLDALVADGTIHDIFNDDVMAILTQAQAATQQAINNIPTVVGTWLGQHVTQETGYVIDDSLTTKNAAADALATGVADSNIKSAVELAFFGEIEDDDFVQGYRTQADYYTVHNQTTRCSSAKYYHVYPGDTISISNIADGTKSAILGAGKTSATNYDSGWKTADFTYTAVNELIVFIEAAKSDDTADILVSDVTTVFTLVDKSTRITDNENAIGELKSELMELESIEVPIQFDAVGNKYIALNMTVGETVSLTPTTADPSTWRYTIINCEPGDTFTLDIVGGSTPRAYGFIDAENKLLSVAPYGAVSATITAPDNSTKLILNDNSGGTAYSNTPEGRVDILETEVEDLQSKEIRKVIGNNIYDYSKNVYGKMFLATGLSVDYLENQYTTGYTSIIIPVDSEYITFSCEDPATRLYNYFFTQSDTFPTAFISNGQPAIFVGSGYTIEVPNGAKYICCSMQNSTERLMVNVGEEALPYEPYNVSYYIEDAKIVTDTSASVEYIKAPNFYNLVVGDTFQLFWKGIINAVKPEHYEIIGRCEIGKSFSEFFEVTPTTAGTYTLTVEVYGEDHSFLESKNIYLIANAKATSPSTQKNVLCVGDSLTASGEWVKELHRRLTASNGSPTGDGLSNINFIGTRIVSGVHFEGYGGWTFNSYNTENVSNTSKEITATHDKQQDDQHSIYSASNGSTWKLETIEENKIKILLVNGNASTFPVSGTLTWVSGGINHSDIVYTYSENTAANPFWNTTTNSVDFANYATNQGVSQIDYVYVLLGWNSTHLTESAYKTQAQTFIDNVHTSFPDAEVVLMGLEIPSASGLAVNYGASGNMSLYYAMQQYVFNLDALYDEMVDENTNVGCINISGQFDTVHNMLTGTRQVNTRNSTTETYQTNGVHPAMSGYLQIADAVYRDITARL